MRKMLIWAAAFATSAIVAVPTYAQAPIPDAQLNAGRPVEKTVRLVRDTRDSRAEAPTVNQLTAVDDARIARIKADLRLTSEQEGYWGKLESALKDISHRRAENFVARWAEERDARDEARNRDNHDQRAAAPTPMDRMRRAADSMNARAADLKSVADASEPIYEKLDDGQRRTLDAALREQLSRAAGLEEGRRRSAEW
jgi:hypothetical protein